MVSTIAAASALHAADKKGRPSAPAQVVSLAKLGYPGASPNMLAAGASVLTVNFLDESHLLLTFGERGLIPRLPDDPPTDEDRMVAAMVVELPSQKVLAKTEWHMHDHGRYLWSLGGGRFLVRIGGDLSVIAPLANLAQNEPFRRVVFPYRGLLPQLVTVSPDNSILTIEAPLPKPKNTVASWADAVNAPTESVLDLFRLSGAGSVADPLTITSTKAVRTARPVAFPVDNDGYLWVHENEERPDQWAIAFHSFSGKSIDLGALQSSCSPRLQLVSPTEFIAFTCRGSDDRLKVAAYGFDAHETWEEPMDSTSGLVFAYAPDAGRFAMSRQITVSADPGAVLPVGETTHQELRVYQTESGDLLLRLNCSPVFRTGENFDLSPSGMLAAVVKDTDLQIYQLPEPSRQDRKDLEEVAKFAPPAGGQSPISFEKVAAPMPKPGEVLAGATPQVAAPVTTTQSVSQAGGSPVVEAKPAATPGTDAAAEPKRAKPTLLLPGEKPEFQEKKKPNEAPSPQ